MGKALYIEACCSCRYFDTQVNQKGKTRYWCNFGPDRVIPASRMDLAAEVPGWCPLPNWDGVGIKKG